MRKSLIVTVAALLGLIAAPCMAKDYIVIDFKEDNSDVLVLDRSTITPVHDNIIAAWDIIFLQGPGIDSDGVVRKRTNFWYDCATPRSAIQAMELFDSATGPALDAWDHPEDELQWDPIDDGSISAYERDFVCGTTTPTEDDILHADSDEELQKQLADYYASVQK